MRLTRTVPLTPAMMAVGDAMDTNDQAVINDQIFADWWHDSNVGTGHDCVLNRTSASVDEVRDVLLPGCPDTPAGRVWRIALESSLALTLADAYRPFDLGEWDDTELGHVNALAGFADELRATSPLLEDVADVVEDQAPTGAFSLGDGLAPRRRITETGIILGRGNYCDKHRDCDDPCYPDGQAVVTWEHLEAIVPQMRARLDTLLRSLDMHFPVFADNDNGAARYGVAYR